MHNIFMIIYSSLTCFYSGDGDLSTEVCVSVLTFSINAFPATEQCYKAPAQGVLFYQLTIFN